jgi:hypothetical protein
MAESSWFYEIRSTAGPRNTSGSFSAFLHRLFLLQDGQIKSALKKREAWEPGGADQPRT